MLKISKSRDENTLHQLGYDRHFELKNKNVSLFEYMILVIKRWILYYNLEFKRPMSNQNKMPITIPKAILHPKKLVPFIWCIKREYSTMSFFRK